MKELITIFIYLSNAIVLRTSSGKSRTTEGSTTLYWKFFVETCNEENQFTGMSWDRSVRIANGYGIDGWGSISTKNWHFSLPHGVKTDSGGHSAPYPWVRVARP
jgi:hypothetical protein